MGTEEREEQAEPTPAEQTGEQPGEAAPDTDPTSGVSPESTQQSPEGASSDSETTDESSEPSAAAESSAPADSPSEPAAEVDPDGGFDSPEGETRFDEAEAAHADEPAGGGLLAGTGSEQQPGVGGTGDHPAPASVVGEDGELHVAGEPPAGTIAGSQAPAGDATDLQSGDVTDPEARERLNAETEPEPIETDRPDIGTE